MSISERFARWVDGTLIPFVLNKAKRDPDISLQEFQDIERQVNDLSKQLQKPRKDSHDTRP